MRWKALLLAAPLIGCAATKSSTPPPVDASAVRRAIDSLDAKAQEWVNSGHGDSLATGYFAPDAVAAAPNGPAAKGTEAIRAMFSPNPAMGRMTLHWTATQMRVSDSLASTQGTYTFVLRAAPPADTSKVLLSDHGNYVTVFVLGPNGWRAVYDIADSELPATPAPPSSKK